MADFDVLAAVSESLVARLDVALANVVVPGGATPFAQLDDLRDRPPDDPPMLTLFLYDIVQDPTVRNRPHTHEIVAGQHVRRRPPLGLVLHYMITAWGGDRTTELQMLGAAMQVLYDDAIIQGPDLQGTLAGTPAQLRVSMAPIYLEDRARVWYAIQQTYRLSINYEVRVVDVDALTEQTTSVVQQREIAAGVPAVP